MDNYEDCAEVMKDLVGRNCNDSAAKNTLLYIIVRQ